MVKASASQEQKVHFKVLFLSSRGVQLRGGLLHVLIQCVFTENWIY